MNWVYYFGRFLSKVILYSVSDWQVKGRENVPDQGSLLIVCNHLHVVDPPIIAASIQIKTVIMAKEELYRGRWSRFWVQNFGTFPVRRGVPDRRALSQAEYWLKQGVSLIMFPEGKRSSTIEMQPALLGSALIASRLNVPVLPVSITGTEKLREPGWWLRRPRITITIGQPFHTPPIDGKLTKDDLTQLTNYIMGHIAGLLPREYQGVYARGESASPQHPGKGRL